MTAEELKNLAINAIEDLKAQDIVVLDVRGKANFTDFMIVASGTSDRHLKAMANEVHIKAKEAGNPPLSTEGEDSRNWILPNRHEKVNFIFFMEHYFLKNK